MAGATRAGLLREIGRLLPTRADYRELPRSWPRDIAAGITVGVVALPLALAFAISSGADAEMGLITAVIAGFVAAVFGGSHVQVSGPTGAMVIVLAPIAAQPARDRGERWRRDPRPDLRATVSPRRGRRGSPAPAGSPPRGRGPAS